ncbi:hypothetical protein AALO_G00088340 [Alosa alosa]|uniref:Uncharacterized protein n=1 Tax=Alosa alosa TaxID=278164 RepID=A0AAV6H2X0_9TELE|nr:hypothetical protein AALO_G00088340 [Alosa alosa]
MAQKWILWVICGTLLALSMEGDGIKVSCGEVVGFIGQKVNVTCTIDYSKVVNAIADCGFEYFTINESDQYVCHDSTYKCDTLVTEIISYILNPKRGSYLFTVKTNCGIGKANFDLMLNAVTDQETPAALPLLKHPTRNFSGVFIAFGLFVLFLLLALTVFVNKRRKTQMDLNA